MGWVSGSRRSAVLIFLASLLVAEGVLAYAFLIGGGSGPAGPPLPLHPVVGTFEPDDTTIEECDDQACFEQAFGNVAFVSGPKDAMALLDESVAAQRIPADGKCHRIAHIIGAASLARNRGNVARTFAEGSSSCFSGYYHGILERSLSEVRSYSADSLGAVVRDLCSDPLFRASPWLADQCAHGLGHGLMIATGYSLPLALLVCERLDARWDRRSCKSGAFMENLSSSYGVTSRYLRDDDPLYPCNWVRGDENKAVCYGLVTSRIIRLGLDWHQTAEVCAGAEKGYVAMCFGSFGRDIAGATRLDPVAIRETCVVARSYGRERACVYGAVRAVVGNYAGGAEAAVICNGTLPKLRAGCYFVLGSVLGSVRSTPAAREADCRALTAVRRHVSACIEGTRGTRPTSSPA